MQQKQKTSATMPYSSTNDIMFESKTYKKRSCEDKVDDARTTDIPFGPNHETITTNLFLPDFVKTIETASYFGCKSIQSLQLSSSLEVIEDDAFCGCSSIEELTLPASVRSLGKSALGHCASIRKIKLQQNQTKSSLERIDDESFRNCTSLVDFPYFPNLSFVGQRAFGGCISLTEITLGPNVTFAARNSFDGCVNLQKLQCTYQEGSILPWAVTDIVIDPSTTKIHNSAFAGCIFLHNISITTLIKYIGKSAFWGCESLPSDFQIPGSVEEVGIGAFGRCSTFLSLKLPLYTTQDTYTFMGGDDMVPLDVKNVVIDVNVREISCGKFEDCSELTELMIPPNVTIIRENAFGRCSSLQKITFHDSAATTIEPQAFQHCENIRIINMPEVVLWVLDGEFGNKTSPHNRPKLPVIHKYAFGTYSKHIVETCKRYSILCQLWTWVLKKEEEYNNFDKMIYNKELEMSLSHFLDTEDLDVFRKILSPQVSAPDDLIFTVLKYKQNRDAILSKPQCNNMRIPVA
mmetsp:Transcript_5590/g.6377  ORF Transcript_5590/g.6377 Transcript_5590/m.6377 type:complete len:519 (-) Transcript_5590:72-1628(-)